MAYKVQFQLDEDILYFEIAGNICHHIDSIAAYVRCRISESRTQNVLLDLRNATGRPGAAKVFTHVLKYPPTRQIHCALIHREHNRDFLLLYGTLMRHRGHKIQLFASKDEGTNWLLTGLECHVATRGKSPGILGRCFQSTLDALSLYPKARGDVLHPKDACRVSSREASKVNAEVPKLALSRGTKETSLTILCHF